MKLCVAHPAILANNISPSPQKWVPKTSSNTGGLLALPAAIAGAVGVVGAVIELCRGVASLCGALDSTNQMTTAFRQAEAQVTHTIAEFDVLLNNCINFEELEAVEDQVERLLGSIASPIACQRIALQIRESACRAQQRIIRAHADGVKQERDSMMENLRQQLADTRSAHELAMKGADKDAADRLSQQINRHEMQKARIDREFQVVTQDAQKRLEMTEARVRSLQTARTDLNQLTGLAGEVAADQFSHNVSSSSQTGSRRSNRGSVLSKPRPSGPATQPGGAYP